MSCPSGTDEFQCEASIATLYENRQCRRNGTVDVADSWLCPAHAGTARPLPAVQDSTADQALARITVIVARGMERHELAGTRPEPFLEAIEQVIDDWFPEGVRVDG